MILDCFGALRAARKLPPAPAGSVVAASTWLA